MRTPIFHVDAFTSHRFKGNPAAVMVMDRFAEDAVLQEIAAENNLSPVTGAAHCMLAPYWAKRLGKTVFRAFQTSRRGGEITCGLVGDRVTLEGGCVFYLEGVVEI